MKLLAKIGVALGSSIIVIALTLVSLLLILMCSSFPYLVCTIAISWAILVFSLAYFSINLYKRLC